MSNRNLLTFYEDLDDEVLELGWGRSELLRITVEFGFDGQKTVVFGYTFTPGGRAEFDVIGSHAYGKIGDEGIVSFA